MTPVTVQVGSAVVTIDLFPAHEQLPAQPMAMSHSQGVFVQNDIADMLKKLAAILPQPFKDWLVRLAVLLEDLDPDGSKPWAAPFAMAVLCEEVSRPSAQVSLPDWFKTECLQQFGEGVKQDALEVSGLMLQKVSGRLQAAVQCLTSGDTPVAQTTIEVAGMQVSLSKALTCAINAALKYFQTRDAGAAISQFFGCLLAGGGGGGGGTGGGASGGPFHKEIDRSCS